MTILRMVLSIYLDPARYITPHPPACIPAVVPQVNSLHRSVSVGIRIAYQQRRPSNVARAENT